MEYLDGIKINKMKELKEKKYDTKLIAKNLAVSFMDQVFGDGVFHADPHPGNFLVLPENTIGMVDFGLVGYLDEHLKQNLANLFIHIV